MDVKEIVTLSVALLLVGVLLPTGFKTFFSVDTSEWNSNVKAIWNLVPLVSMVGLIIALVAGAFYSSRQSRGGRVTAGYVIGMTVAILVLAIILPIGLEPVMEAFNGSYANLGATSSTPYISTIITMGSLIGVLVLAGLVIGIIYNALRS